VLTSRYNAGRDELVGNVTGTMIPLQSVTNQSTFSGQTSFGNYTYQTDVTYVSGLLNDTSGKYTYFGKSLWLMDRWYQPFLECRSRRT
jgi:hypothetical protein